MLPCRPETMGLPAASIYLLLLILFIPFPFTVNSAMGLSKTGPFPHEEVRWRSVQPSFVALGAAD